MSLVVVLPQTLSTHIRRGDRRRKYAGRSLEFDHVGRGHGRHTRGACRAQGHGVGGGRWGRHTRPDRGHGNMDEQLLQHAAAGDGG